MLTEEEKQRAAHLTKLRDGVGSGDAESIAELERLANSGSTDAMLSLGTAYESGRNLNFKEAERWYRTAHLTRPTEATMYLFGQFLYWNRRDEEAKALFLEGAESGFGICKYRLAVLYAQDKSLQTQKSAEIRQLLEEATDEGYVRAKVFLARLLMRGKYGLRNVPLGIAKFFQSLVDFARIVSKNPDDPRLLE